MHETMNKPKARERLVTLWSMRETLGLVEVLEQINALLEQGHITAEDLASVQSSAGALGSRTSSSAAARRNEDVGDALIEFRRKRAQRRKDQSINAAIHRPKKKLYSDWSPAAIFGDGEGGGGGRKINPPQSHDSNQHCDSDAQAVKKNAIANYAAEVFQRCWQTSKFRCDVKEILSQYPYSRFRVAILAVQRSFRICRRRHRFRAALSIQRQFQVWKLRVCYSRFLRGFRTFVKRWRTRRQDIVRHKSACVLQTAVRAQRAYLRRKHQLLQRKLAAQTLQKWNRKQKLLKQVAERHRMLEAKSAAQLQAYVRARKVRVRFQAQKKGAVTIQRGVRRKSHEQHVNSRNQASVSIQRSFRTHVVWNKKRSLRKLIAISALSVQRWYRCCQLRHRKKFLDALVLTNAARLITHCIRTFACQRAQACRVIQQWLVAHIIRRTRVQRACERKRQARELASALQEALRKVSAVKIQTTARRRIAMQQLHKIVHAIIVIQQAYVSTLEHRRVLRNIEAEQKGNEEKKNEEEQEQEQHHQQQQDEQQQKVAFYCPAFLRNGVCPKGDACMFIHEINSTATAAATVSVSANITVSAHVVPKLVGTGAGRLYGGTKSTMGNPNSYPRSSLTYTIDRIDPPIQADVVMEGRRSVHIPAASSAKTDTEGNSSNILARSDRRVEYVNHPYRPKAIPNDQQEKQIQTYHHRQQNQHSTIYDQEQQRDHYQQHKHAPAWHQQHQPHRRRKPRMAYTHLYHVHRAIQTTSQGLGSQRSKAERQQNQHAQQRHSGGNNNFGSNNNNNSNNTAHNRRNYTLGEGSVSANGKPHRVFDDSFRIRKSAHVSYEMLQGHETDSRAAMQNELRLPRLPPMSLRR